MIDRYQELIERLVSERYLVNPLFEEAFRKTQRSTFLRREHRMLEGLDAPFPIGCNQTTSQPLTVAFMVNLLNPQQGDSLLEIGFGSGWLTCILARIVCACQNQAARSGEIHAYEIVKELADYGKRNIQKDLPKSLLTHVHLHDEDFALTSKKNSPYDRIIASAAFDRLPRDLISELSIDGILVYPTHQHEIRKITRTSRNTFDEDIFPGYVFVPITHKN